MEQQGLTLPSVDEMETLIDNLELSKLRQILVAIHPADIADLLDELPPEKAVIAFELLSIEVGSEVLDETGSLVRQELLDKVDEEKLADLLDELPMDDAAEFLEDLPDDLSDRLIMLMEPEEAAEVQELLGYEEDSAGRLMTRDVAALRRFWTVDETFRYLRSLEEDESLHYLYVVDRDDRLIGVVPLRRLITAQPEATVESIMVDQVVAVPVTADQEELAEMVARYDFVSIPVVDEDGRFLGAVTVDDVLDIVEEEATEDIQRLGGSEPLDQPYFAVSVLQVVKKRIGWLLLLFIAATLTGSVIKLFENELNIVISLSLFIPLIIGTGGNAGSQTVATIIRAITLDEVRLSNIWQAVRREVSVGLILGAVMAVAGYIRAIIWVFDTDPNVAFVVALTLPVVVIWAITVATIIPILADRFKIDPTVISGPMITTIVDATGLLIYFLLARVILTAI
ncbi:MAG: magnesium transporter [Ardenticatenaceae bacterium]|nr:magnesium transporter [Ardenticatenaceae bacterium]MCB8988658.1 magnesium transporter [Ardenticatenaceae bacterium]